MSFRFRARFSSAFRVDSPVVKKLPQSVGRSVCFYAYANSVLQRKKTFLFLPLNTTTKLKSSIASVRLLYLLSSFSFYDSAIKCSFFLYYGRDFSFYTSTKVFCQRESRNGSEWVARSISLISLVFRVQKSDSSVSFVEGAGRTLRRLSAAYRRKKFLPLSNFYTRGNNKPIDKHLKESLKLISRSR